MAESYYTILTSIGKAQMANALGLGTKIDFVKMKIGDGNGTYYNPTESQTDLVHTVWEGAIGHVAIDEENPNWINIEVLIPPDIGVFFIREYGVFDANNNMLAIAKCAETYKPLPVDGSTKEINMKMVLAISNTSSVTLKIDPTIIFAKKSEVEAVKNQVNIIATEVENARKGKANLKEKIDEIDSSLSDLMYQVAGGTATALTLTIKGTLVTGYPITFIASANNSGTATTINGKKLYKPATTNTPNLIKDKAYTVWYNATGDNGNGCFFIKASAEGDADVSHVLATKKFSNDNDTGLIGTMPNNGALSGSLNCGNSFNIPAGYTSEGTITANSLASQTADATATAGNIVSGYTAYKNGSKITGTYDVNTPLYLVPGTGYLLYWNSAATWAAYSSYTQYRAATNRTIGGTVTVSFTMYSDTSGVSNYARIYVNGVPRGIERVQTTTPNTIYTENITINAGDTIQVYIHSNGIAKTGIIDFKITCGNSYGAFS